MPDVFKFFNNDPSMDLENICEISFWKKKNGMDKFISFIDQVKNVGNSTQIFKSEEGEMINIIVHP